MTDITTDIATVDETRAPGNEVAELIASFNDAGSVVYSSMRANTFDERVALVAAIGTTEKLSDNLGKTINLVHFVAQPITLMDPATGVVNDAARVILIDEDGTGYYAVSLGIAQALRNFVAVIGEPSYWERPLPVIASEERTRRGFRVMTLKPAPVAAPAVKPNK